MRRRKFLWYSAAGTAGLAGAGTAWIASSKRRAARWARRFVADSRRPVLKPSHCPDPALWSTNEITLAWLGHSTVLINFYGIRILTDPVLGSRIGVALGPFTVGPKRYVAPALRFHDLPSIDVLLLSHAHMDHMDVASLRHFAPTTFTVTAKASTDVLQSARLRNITELGWGEQTRFQGKLGDLEIRAVEVQHWGERCPSELPRGYNGYILRREGKSLLFGGDTALTSAFDDLRARGPFKVAIMPIGAYRPWIWNHCSPEQAWELANRAGADFLLPVHHQTFQLSEEPMREPIGRLQEAMSREPERLALKEIGQTFRLPKHA